MSGKGIMAAVLLVGLIVLYGCGLKTNPQPPAPKQKAFVSR